MRISFNAFSTSFSAFCSRSACIQLSLHPSLCCCRCSLPVCLTAALVLCSRSPTINWRHTYRRQERLTALLTFCLRICLILPRLPPLSLCPERFARLHADGSSDKQRLSCDPRPGNKVNKHFMSCYAGRAAPWLWVALSLSLASIDRQFPLRHQWHAVCCSILLSPFSCLSLNPAFQARAHS